MDRALKDNCTVRTLLLLAAAAVLANAGFGSAQTPALGQKVLTPDQKDFQAKTAQWRRERAALRARAQAAFDAETEREKRGDCPGAASTGAAVECLTAEIAKTQANYATFAGAIRAMLALAAPTMPGASPVSGPTGMPQTTTEAVTEFDQLEAESKKYREHAASAAYNRYKGGTEAPVFQLEAEQRLLRLHLQEVAFIYESLLANR